MFGFNEEVIIIHNAGNFDESFYKNIFQFNKESKACYSRDDSVKGLANFICHELRPPKTCDFSFDGHGLDFHLCGLLGYFR